jgi:cysteine desulfurase
MIYFDHNASTPVRPEAADAMSRVLRELHANPSSTHREGQRVRAALEDARGHVAALVGARTDEVVFVSGGTEGDHAGLIGAAWAHESRGRRVAISAIEHHAMHGAAEVAERIGFAVEHLPVDANGIVDPSSIDALPDDTTVVSVMLANNETGVVQPVAAIAERATARGMVVHCDAVQAGGKIEIDVEALGVSYLVVSAHKLGGPKGAGALIVRRDAPFEPLFRGTAHEKGRRGGTENAPSIVGFGVAAKRAREELGSERTRLLALRNAFESLLAAAIPDMVVHSARAPRLPNTVNASFPGARSDTLLMALDARGVAVSAGAACSSGAVEPSPVLKAMQVPRPLATSALRMSMGWTTTEDEVAQVAEAVIDAVRAIRKTAVQATS